VVFGERTHLVSRPAFGVKGMSLGETMPLE
jgi:hypothetical protein